MSLFVIRLKKGTPNQTRQNPEVYLTNKYRKNLTEDYESDKKTLSMGNNVHSLQITK